MSTISNQISSEFRQPRIRNAIEQTAKDQGREMFTNEVIPSIAAFQDALNAARERLAKASNSITDLQMASSNEQQRLADLFASAERAVVRTNAPPAVTNSAPSLPQTVKLLLANRVVTQTPNSYVLTLFFRVSGGATSGPAEIIAGTYKQSARILSFSPLTSPTKTPAEIDDAGDAARLRFYVAENESPTIAIELSGPTIVRFISESFDNDLIVPIAADKLSISNASK